MYQLNNDTVRVRSQWVVIFPKYQSSNGDRHKLCFVTRDIACAQSRAVRNSEFFLCRVCLWQTGLRSSFDTISVVFAKLARIFWVILIRISEGHPASKNGWVKPASVLLVMRWFASRWEDTPLNRQTKEKGTGVETGRQSRKTRTSESVHIQAMKSHDNVFCDGIRVEIKCSRVNTCESLLHSALKSSLFTIWMRTASFFSRC